MNHPIIFFDGVCVLCNRFVDRVLRADTRSIFRFAPLQGETARMMLPPCTDDPLTWSVVYLDEHGMRRDSDATFEILRRLGGGWKLLAAARFLPRTPRDAVYRVVAERRYRWFGRRESCRLPDPAERDRFLP